MNILFVCSGNSTHFAIAPFIKVQGESLSDLGINVSYFSIHGKGIKGYIKNIPKLRRHLKNNKYDLIHAHYALSGLVAILSIPKTPVICSFMGSDAYGDTNKRGKVKLNSYVEITLAKFIQPFLKKIIVKSPNILETIWLKKKSIIIPNGVDLNQFNVLDKKKCRNKLNLNQDETMVLFLGNPNSTRKNIYLLKQSLKILNNPAIKLINPYPINHSEMVYWINAADVIALTSFNEGSPNVIKEAMACNATIVSTKVGDVPWLFNNTEGLFLGDFNSTGFSVALKNALNYAEKNHKAEARKRILDLKLDSESIAKRILALYSEVFTSSK